MKIVIMPKPSKYLNKLHEPDKGRIIKAIDEHLTKEPPQGDIKSLQGRAGYRLRVGKYRVLYQIQDDTLVITNIGPRGQIYND